ncbi:hypothetical protein AQI95_05370 [Streptomyces yokosukanensis]|uniref:Glucose-methanol-choline oxidoreductase N-terminal domain-containing protein n=1 Tax=Streptomyces yokosukanensis TaxID=67386 RepID=A0A117Q5F8_9ACTN|nr:GMC family oxidoreductase N-terminal domain-containing protein [Streptomyces yokosukanensis]KUN09264.1 hypothetical protein AQI95_05370 [Streptomyces yokosukanensis]
MVATKSFDYVVVGAGTAGCVLATRLSENPGVSVALLEAGGESGPESMHSPNAMEAFGLWGSPVDWAYATTPQAGTGGTVHAWPRGKVLGGSSSINGMVHRRGHRSSFDAWEAQGATGWSYDTLLPFLKRSESTQSRDPRFRGTDGPMRIEAGSDPTPLDEAMYQAALESGHAASADGNGEQDEGVAWGETNVVADRRQSAADAYLRPALARPNLTVITHAHVRRLLLDGTRCRGAEYVADGTVHTVAADREVILSAGAVGSPQLLLLSGIGPAAHLQDVGIPVRADLPGVGENLHDHLLSWVSYRAKQPVPAGPSRQAYVLARSAEGVDPDVQLSFTRAALEPLWAGADPDGFSVLFSVVTPASRGSLRLRSADPTAHPLIDPAYLTDDADVDRMVTALSMARRLAAADALAQWRGAELLPGSDVLDEDACRAYVRATAATYFHPVGTCRIGVDALAVVDPQLRVRGIEALRVADASVMPSVVSANTNAAVLGIAERATQLVEEPAFGTASD